MPVSFPTLERALIHYDTSLAFSNETADWFVQRMLSEPGARDRAKAELSQALNDGSTPWPELLTNGRYEVDDRMPAAEAKELILDLLWDAIYPELQPRTTAEPCRVYASNDGDETDISLEEIASGRTLARIVRLNREGDKLVVEYAQLGSPPHPATLRKYLRDALRQLLQGQEILADIRTIEFIETERKTRVILPF